MDLSFLLQIDWVMILVVAAVFGLGMLTYYAISKKLTINPAVLLKIAETLVYIVAALSDRKISDLERETIISKISEIVGLLKAYADDGYSIESVSIITQNPGDK